MTITINGDTIETGKIASLIVTYNLDTGAVILARHHGDLAAKKLHLIRNVAEYLEILDYAEDQEGRRLTYEERTSLWGLCNDDTRDETMEQL